MLGNTGRLWANVFSRENSGTYNDEWMVMDFNRYQPDKEGLLYDFLLVLDQAPSTVSLHDRTDWLIQVSQNSNHHDLSSLEFLIIF